MLDILIAVLIVCVTLVTAYLGVHVTLHPPDTVTSKRWYKVGFFLCGLIGCCLVAIQTWRNGKTQGEIIKILTHTDTTTEQISKNTKQPPQVTITNPQVVIKPDPSLAIPKGSMQVSKWLPYPTNGTPIGVHVHILNTWPTPKGLAITQASAPILLSDINTFDGIARAEDNIWGFLIETLKNRPIDIIEIPNNTDQAIHIDLPDDTKKLIESGSYGAVVAIAGRNSKGAVVFEACAFLTEHPNEVMLCNKHNRIASKID
jgi:hypothetical protein